MAVAGEFAGATVRLEDVDDVVFFVEVEYENGVLARLEQHLVPFLRLVHGVLPGLEVATEIVEALE